MKKISIIVAVDLNNGIGKNNKLLCHIPEDLKRFKKITTNNVVIMGKNTYHSLPIKPLPNRENIVISDEDEEYIGCKKVSSIEEAINEMSDIKENFIIGGASIYKQFYPMANKIYLTIINNIYDADTFFPKIDEQWRISHEENIICEISHKFIILER